eukprot:6172200-Pleurochrysis_carterae.AAC.1
MPQVGAKGVNGVLLRGFFSVAQSEPRVEHPVKARLAPRLASVVEQHGREPALVPSHPSLHLVFRQV